jgi:hypothetical protein
LFLKNKNTFNYFLFSVTDKYLSFVSSSGFTSFYRFDGPNNWHTSHFSVHFAGADKIHVINRFLKETNNSEWGISPIGVEGQLPYYHMTSDCKDISRLVQSPTIQFIDEGTHKAAYSVLSEGSKSRVIVHNLSSDLTNPLSVKISILVNERKIFKDICDRRNFI